MMNTKEQEFLKRLRATFQIEAEEHLRAISAGIIKLENTTEALQRAKIVEDIFREVHSLKGAARSVSRRDIESTCQPFESVLAGMKNQQIELSKNVIDLLLKATDGLSKLVFVTESDGIPNKQIDLRELNSLLEEVTRTGVISAKEVQAQALNPIKPVPVVEMPTMEMNKPISRTDQLTETVRVSIKKLDPLLLQAEEMIQTKLASAQRTIELREIQEELLLWEKESKGSNGKLTSDSNKLPDWATVRLALLIEKVTDISQVFEQDKRTLQRMVDDHLKAIKQILMLPISTMVEGFPRLVRDLAMENGKEVNLVIVGGEIEIDKRILEELKGPLIHLIRNSVDHGIEIPEVRVKKQKPATGTIMLIFSIKDSHRIEIRITDDGVGIDSAKVLSAAVKSNAITNEAAKKMNSLEILRLIFQSGLSTSEIITDISGRGLGLAIVREKTEQLGGTVSVDTSINKGTTFQLVLPLTLTTFRGVFVRLSEAMYVLPLINVERVLKVQRDEVKTVDNREIIKLDGQIIPLIKLNEVLKIPVLNKNLSKQNSKIEHFSEEFVSVLILTLAEKRIAFQVDEVLFEEEVLVKGLGKQLKHIRNINGVTVLGTGKIVPVLNVADIMKSAIQIKANQGLSKVTKNTGTKTKHIMVAEDSITARMMLKNILEASGYQVTTAYDGMDAFNQLNKGQFDLVVSDVDMPRLSGFELTTKIRATKKLSQLPVVLVTSLESRQDREHGIEVGANAYIIKSNFEDSNLNEVIEKLL